MSRFKGFSIIVSVCLICAGSVRAQEEKVLRYLAVGASESPGAAPLPLAKHDALSFARTWQAQKGKLYQDVKGEVLVAQYATRANILAGLDRLIRQTAPGDTVAITLAGHGSFLGDRTTAWIFTGADYSPLHVRQTSVTADDLREKFVLLQRKTSRIFLFLDSCRAGAAHFTDVGCIVFAGCRSSESCYDHIGNGLFTFAVLEALEGRADVNRDGIVTLAETEAFVQRRMSQILRDPRRLKDGREVYLSQHAIFLTPGTAHADLRLSVLRTPTTGTILVAAK